MDALGIETMVFQDCLCQVWVLIVWAIQFQSHPPKNFKNYAFNSNIIMHTLIVLTCRNGLKMKSFYTFWAQLSSRNMRDMRHCYVVCLSIFYYVSNSCFQTYIGLIFVFDSHCRPPTYHPQTSAPPPPPLLYFSPQPQLESSSPFGGITRRHATEKHAKRYARSRAFFARHKWSAFLHATSARYLINWCQILCNVRSFSKYLPLFSSIFFRCWTWLSQKFQVLFLFCLVQYVVMRSLRTFVE